MGRLTERQSRHKGQGRNMWQKEGKGRKGLSWFIYRSLGQFAWLVACSFLWSSWHRATSQIWDSQTSSYEISQETPWSVCHPLRFEVRTLLSQQTQVIPYYTKKRWQWCSAPVQLTLINAHTLLTLEQHLGKMAINKGLQDPFLWHQFFFQPPQLCLY